MRTRLRSSFLTFALLLAAASCSDGKSKPTGTDGSGGTTGTGGTSSTASQCDVISISEIETILGVTDLGAPRITDVGSLTHCQYPRGTIPATVQIRYDLATSRAHFDEDRTSFDTEGYPTTDVPGLGETAFTSTTGGIVTIGTFRGGKSLLVNAPASLERVRALCAELLTRI
jgi:hypothetical protein